MGSQNIGRWWTDSTAYVDSTAGPEFGVGSRARTRTHLVVVVIANDDGNENLMLASTRGVVYLFAFIRNCFMIIIKYIIVWTFHASRGQTCTLWVRGGLHADFSLISGINFALLCIGILFKYHISLYFGWDFSLLKSRWTSIHHACVAGI